MTDQTPNICNYVNMAIAFRLCSVEKQLSIDEDAGECDMNTYKLLSNSLSRLRNNYPECHDEKVDKMLDDAIMNIGKIEPGPNGCKGWNAFSETDEAIDSYIDTIVIGEAFFTALGRGTRFGTGGVQER